MNKQLLLDLLNTHEVVDFWVETRMFKKPIITFVLKTLDLFHDFSVEIEIEDE